MKYQNIQTYFFISIFLIASILSLALFFPYFIAILTGFLLAVIIHPFYFWLKVKYIHNENVAALLSVIVVFCALIVPVSLFGIMLFDEARNIYISLVEGNGGVEPFVVGVMDRISGLVPGLTFESIDIGNALAQVAQAIIDSLGSVFSTLVASVLNIVIALITLFYMLRDGEQIKQKVVAISPLADYYDSMLIDRMKKSINVVIRGTLLVRLIQGGFATISYVVFGVPMPFFWGAITTFASLLPVVGTSLVWLPLAVYMYFTNDSIVPVIGLLAWNGLVTVHIDNFLAPIIIDKGLELHPLLILLSILGGLKLFGVLGIIIGPIILSIWNALFSVYQKEFYEYSNEFERPFSK